tara:strand:+ start:64 stop:1476 length:1413 start_codon:yes stop_codon:yes gene_type:complete
LSANTSIGGLEFNTNDASSGGTGIGASIEAKADGNFGSDQQGVYLAFSTRDSGSGETNTERMRIDSSGNVGIGASPSDYNSAAHNLVIYESGGSGMTLASGTSGQGAIYFADGTSGDAEYRGYIIYEHGSNDLMRFGTAATERMRLNSDGDLLLGSSTDAGYGPLQIGSTSTASTIAQFLSATDGVNTIHFGDATSGTARYRGYIQYRHNGDKLTFGTSASDAVIIDSSGNVGIGTDSPSAGLTLEGTDGATGTTFMLTSTGVASAGLACDANGLNFGADTGGFVFKTGASANDPTDSGTERMRISSNGHVAIGTTSDSFPLVVSTGAESAQLQLARPTDGSQRSIALFRSSSQGANVGEINVTNTATTYGSTSDYRLKENVSYDWDATTRLKKLKPARFNFIAESDETVDGFLAHEVQSVVPQAVSGTHNEVDDDGNPVHQSMDASKLVPLLVKTIQELEARLTALEGE